MNQFHLRFNNIALSLLGLVFLSACSSNSKTEQASTQNRPNIILVMVDDMGYGDLGAYGQEVIQTPHLDKMVKEGLLFTQFYSGSPVCAPARGVLMTGQHTGHTTVRGNFGKGGVEGLAGKDGRIPLKSNDTTLAEVLKKAGYITAMTGKWGIGEPGTSGEPNDQGFDEWFGYLNQKRAHHHYADYLWKNKEKYPIPQNEGGNKEVYTHHLFTDFALDFIGRQAEKEQPFFLYVPYLLPHSDYEIPEINPLYKDRDWTEEEKVYASMVSLIDNDMGRIRDTLKALGIAENTLVVFTSDNGPAQSWEVFNSNAHLEGKKRDVYEGGIRIPMLVAMPGTVPAGQTNSTIGYFADVLPTLAAIAGTESPENIDGVNLEAAFLNGETLSEPRALYWEFMEQDGKQAVRKGQWKAVRLNVHEKGFHDEVELYDLEADLSETNNIAERHPEIVTEMKQIMEQEHVASEQFSFRFEEEEQE